MKKIFITIPVITVFFVSISAWGQNNSSRQERGSAKVEKVSENKKQAGKKILTVYFSHSGNTREIANQIQRKVGGDIFEIQTVQAYPTDYDAVVQQAKQEQNSNYKPKLKSRMKNIESYDVVFIGYPNWWGTMPMPFVTFFSEYNFPGKIIVPFCTHEGSGLGRSVNDIKKLCPQAKILDGIAIRGSSVKKAQYEISEWLRKIGMAD